MPTHTSPHPEAAWPADPSQPPKQRWSVERILGALRRRTRYVWSRLNGIEQKPPAEIAFDWLRQHDADEGVPPSTGTHGCPGVTGGAIETAMRVGATELAQRWARWLVIRQSTDGWWSDASMLSPSLLNTGQAIRGLLAAESLIDEVETNILSGCRFLLKWIEQTEHGATVVGAVGQHCTARPTCSIVSALPPLLAASRRYDQPEWEATARRTLARCLPSDDAVHLRLPLVELAWWVETLIELDYTEAATAILDQLALRQRRDGSLRARGTASIEANAHLATCAYRLGRRAAADHIMRFLFRAFPRSPETGWAVKYYLDAAMLEVQAAFAADATNTGSPNQTDELPTTIDPADGRVEKVRQWCSDLPENAAVADVGCGRGRFLRHLAESFPSLRLTGIDPSETLLADCPSTVATFEGDLLRMPVADAAFDAAFAVESFEHALLPQQAVAELCRVVRPGGHILIIDKHRDRQPLSEHEPWERWFTPEELSIWLRRYCNNVTVEPVSHLEGIPADTLFLAASATRRG